MKQGPLVRVLASQLLALGLVGAAAFAMVSALGMTAPLWSAVFAQSLLATAISYLSGIRQWWLGVQFMLPILAAFSLTLPIPGWVYLVAFVVLVLVYSNVSSERVPLYLSNRTTWAALS